MNHDSKHNDFEYEKEIFPKTPEHFKQLVTTCTPTLPDFMLENYDMYTDAVGESQPYITVLDAYYDGNVLSIYGQATEFGMQTTDYWYVPDRIFINDIMFCPNVTVNLDKMDSHMEDWENGAFYAEIELPDTQPLL